jgi:hypothetical protein
MASTKKTPDEDPKQDPGGDGTQGQSTLNDEADASAPPTGALNQQIVQAVDLANDSVLGAAAKEAQSIAYQKVAQAAAFAVQDATDYLRNVEAIALAAQGVALKLMIQNNTTSNYADIMKAAQDAVTAAQTNLGAVGQSADEVATKFPTTGQTS